MKRSELKRKTPLQSRGTSDKPRKPLRKRSKTQRKFRDDNLQQYYRDQFDYCEVSPWLRRNWPEMYFRDDVLALHHIVPGNGGRYDVWSNMIRINQTFHGWLTDHDNFNGNIVCLGVKLRNNALDLGEYRKCAGWRLEGWLLKREPRPEVRSLWEELRAFSKNESDDRYQ